jgi:uncharacterized OsmC-like protein
VQAIETTVEIDLGDFLGIPNIKPGLHNITVTTRLKGKGDPDKIKELLEIAEERCQVLDVLKNGLLVQVNVELK